MLVFACNIVGDAVFVYTIPLPAACLQIIDYEGNLIKPSRFVFGLL